VILLWKPRKNDFRPSLVSCVLKIREKMIKRKIERFIELDCLLPDIQFDFRKGKFCEDCLVLINLEIYKAFIMSECVRAVFLDIKTAYDNPFILFNLVNDVKISKGYKMFIRNHLLDYCLIEIYKSNFKEKIWNSLIESFNKVNSWLLSINLELSIPKTQFIVFNRMRNKTFPDILKVVKLRRLNKVKYLGLLLDSGLRGIEYIRFLKIKVSIYLNILK